MLNFLLGLVALPALGAAVIFFFFPHPILCPVVGHKWRPFDMNWCGTDYYRCMRCGVLKDEPTPIREK